MFAWREDDGPLTRLVTDRLGGASTGPYAEFNLGDHVGDDPGAVTANRRLLAAALGLEENGLVFMRQVHGIAVADASTTMRPRPGDDPVAEADALVSAEPGVALVVLVADCIPVLLWDARTGVIGAAHAGRPGLRAGVLPAVVAAMHALGAREVRAVLGPAVCGDCYEVPESMRDDVVSVLPQSWARSRTGTPALDLRAGALAQLAGLGVAAEAAGGCTFEDDAYFSYRRDGRTGRCAGVIVRRAS